MGLFSSVRRLASKYGSTALTIGTIVSGVTAVVLSYRAGKRAGQHPEWDTKEKVMNCVATGAAEAVSVGCAVAAHREDSGKIATLMATQLLDEKKRQKMMRTLEDKIGKENLDKIKASMHPIKDEEVEPREDGRLLVIDEFTQARGYGTIDEVWNGINKFQTMYHTDGYIAYGKLLEFCNLERIDGKNRILPYGETDDEGVDLMGLSDMDIGYSSYYLGEMGYDTDWVDIIPTIHRSADGYEYILIVTDHYPIAQYETY